MTFERVASPASTNCVVIMWVEGAVGKMEGTNMTSSECSVYRSESYIRL
jgi:hypothetical protein